MTERFTVTRISPATDRSVFARVIDRLCGRPSARLHLDSVSIPIAPELAKRVEPGLVLAGLETTINTVSCGEMPVALPARRDYQQARALAVRHQSWGQFLRELCYSWLQEGIFGPIVLPGYYLRVELCVPPPGVREEDQTHWSYIRDLPIGNTARADVLAKKIRLACKNNDADPYKGLPIDVLVTHDRFGAVHVSLPR